MPTTVLFLSKCFVKIAQGPSVLRVGEDHEAGRQRFPGQPRQFRYA